MGHVREKYSKIYFTGRKPDGTPAGYGLEGNFDGSETTLRDFDVKILDKINFQNKHVLEIGYGRGESIKYLLNHGIASYVGVDFAEPAYEIANEFLKQNNYHLPKIYCFDALEFVRDHAEKIPNTIDIVLMLDVVEHIPRHELSLIFHYLRNYLSEKAIIVLNTPAYRFDNDVLSSGLDERNFIDAVDHADFIPETQGMHCNKFSILSLQEYMRENGFLAISEAHVFVQDKTKNHLSSGEVEPYAKLWSSCYLEKYPLNEEYLPDEIEYAFNQQNKIELLTIQQGLLKGFKFWGLQTAFTSFQEDGSLAHYEKYIKANDIVFDVGCYIGLSALLFAKLVGKNGKVISFEPNKYNLLRIKNNFSANPDIVNNIMLYEFGLSEANIISEMLLSDDIESGYSSASQLVKGGRIAIPQSELESLGFFKEKIQLKSLDSFVQETGIIPNVIKIEIEGAEVSFIKGGINTISNHKPILFIELHNVFATCIILQILDQLNYSFHVLSEEWGNRVQIVALNNSIDKIALSNKDYIEEISQSYYSYKAKLYQENLEIYAKQKQQLYHNLQKKHQDLYEQHEHLENQFRELELKNIHLQAVQNYLNSLFFIKFGKFVKKVLFSKAKSLNRQEA